jgi:hypothetical protein
MIASGSISHALNNNPTKCLEQQKSFCVQNSKFHAVFEVFVGGILGW